MAITINHQTNDISATSGSLTIDGAAVGGGGLVLMSTATISSAVVSVDFDLDNASYSSYQVVFDSVIPSTDNNPLLVRFSSDGGSTFDSGGSDYQYAARSVATNGTASDQSDNADSAINLSAYVGNATGETGVNGKLDLISSGLGRPSVRWQISRTSSAGIFIQNWGAGERTSIVEVNGLRFLYGTGNIASGKIYLYGLK